MRNLLILLTLFVPLIGCDSLLPKKQASAAPAWVLSTPADSREWFWGVGEGPDLDTAKRAALKDIAAKLRVSISAQLESQISVDNNKVDRKARTRISEEVQKTEFNNFVVEKTAQSGNGFFALVKVDRQAFIRDIKQKLGNLDSLIQPAAAELGKKTPLEKFVALRRLQPNLEKATGHAQLLTGLEPGAASAERLSRLESLQQQAQKAATDLVFRVQAGSSDGDLAAAITAFLNENGIRTENTASGRGNVLAIASSSRSDAIYGSKLVKLKVTLSVQDDHGRAVTSRDFEVSGSSSYDYAGARQSATQKLGAALRDVGPIKGLGFTD
ncbi:MAG: hypothetical protein B7Y41_13675 [Hydrogenophilales bacterium 28-61-23]|nr:MAG: hypothetical protein B7Y41_13675 [Hydrogenophilales bacterium 28-61-23]